MTFEIFNFSVKPESTKDMIIMILSEEFPLTLPKIKNILQKKYQKTISYQGIYKELNLMIEKKIIIKEEKSYLLNKEWILNLNKYSEHLYLTYSNQVKYSITDILKLKNEADSLTLKFNSLYEMDKFFINLLYIFNEYFDKNEPIFMHYKNNTWPFLYNFDEFNFMNKLKSKFYSLCITASQVDSWACEFEKQIGMQVKVVSKKTPFWSFHLFGPYVINYIVDEKISEEIKDFFVNNSKMNQLDLSKLNALINKTGEFKVIFMINNEIKKQLLEEIKLNFK